MTSAESPQGAAAARVSASSSSSPAPAATATVAITTPLPIKRRRSSPISYWRPGPCLPKPMEGWRRRRLFTRVRGRLGELRARARARPSAARPWSAACSLSGKWTRTRPLPPLATSSPASEPAHWWPRLIGCSPTPWPPAPSPARSQRREPTDDMNPLRGQASDPHPGLRAWAALGLGSGDRFESFRGGSGSF
jgi:hypothetical protein